MARREKSNRGAQPKKTRGVIDISKGGMSLDSFFFEVTCSLDDDEEGVLDNLLQCLQTGSVFKQ